MKNNIEMRIRTKIAELKNEIKLAHNAARNDYDFARNINFVVAGLKGKIALLEEMLGDNHGH